MAVLKKIFESVPDAIVIINQAGRIVRVNTEAGKLFGYDPDELLGQMVEVLVPERLRAKHVAHWEPLPPVVAVTTASHRRRGPAACPQLVLNFQHLSVCRPPSGAAAVEISTAKEVGS